jgi:4-deoxy-L-threo-5-hexosulose-uronate ketol-isomerase
MLTLHLPDPVRYRTLDSAALRQAFLLESLFIPGRIELRALDLDRAIVGGVVPLAEALALQAPAALRASHFCQRRELGIINVGGPGRVTADRQRFAVRARQCVYVGRGTETVRFESDDPANPAAFFLTSFPAHADHPTVHVGEDRARVIALGTPGEANVRTLYQYIHPEGVKSCQLVMGYTALEAGSVWNTQPPHTHERRSEIYLYFDLAPEARVMHFMGTPEETRHLVVADRQAVVSPSWSVHFGAGTASYRFVWAMGGENQIFDDIQPVPSARLR